MIVLLISIIAIGLTILLYYKNLARVPLRILSLIILYLLITGFVLPVRLKKESNPPALLIDYSASMARYFPTIVQKTDAIDFPHSRFFFSESLFSTMPENGLPSGKFTDITGAILKVNKMHPSAIILISDGNHNYGAAPFAMLEDLDIPVYCFGVGTETKRDLAIIDISYPEYIFVGDSVHFEVTVQSQGFEGGRGSIQLTSTQKKREQKRTFLLSDVKAKNKIDFWVYASQLGDEKFFVRLAPQPGEETYENNEFEFSLRVLKKKLKVFYYTEHVSFNTKFILRALEEDNHVNLLALGKIDKKTYQNLNTNQRQMTLPELDGFDVLLLDNIGLDKLPWQDIEKFLKRGLGILCMGTIEGHTEIWRDILPINTSGSPIKGIHQITVIEPFSCLAPGDDYPPLTYINRVMGVKDNAVIIAEANHMPIIAFRGYGQGIIFQINVVDIGTWQFIQLGLKQKNLLSCLITDIVRFISPEGQHKRLALKSLRKDYTIGETIELTVQSFDRSFKRTGGGDFYTEFDKKRIPFFEVAKGVYKASFVANKSGHFQLKASGKLNEEALSSDELEIRISTRAIEIEQGLNRQFLQTLSAETGGLYYSIDGLDTFNISLPKDHYMLKKINIDSPISYFILFALLAIDWFLRRRQGII